MNVHPLLRIAAAQHGVVALHQAARHGIGRPHWRSLCRDGFLVEEFPDVARLAGAPPGALPTIKAATLAVGDGAMASHTSSGVVWGVACIGVGPVHLAVADRRRDATHGGVMLHRPTDLDDLHAVIHRGIPTTRPLRTLCDIGAVDPSAVGPALQHFLVSGTIRPEAAWRALQQHRRPGRAGVRALEAALASLSLGSKPPDSMLEEAMGRLFARYALPPFVFHAVVEGFEVDFLVAGTNVVIETDGWTSHGLDRNQFEFDREKDAVLREAGFVVQRFTWLQIVRRPAWVAERIRGTLRRWAPDVPTA